MFNSPWRSIIWSGIFALMMLSLISPFSIFTVSFMAIPIYLLYMTLEKRSFALHIGIALGVVVVLTGGAGITMLVIALFFIVPAVVMGEALQRGYPTQVAVLASILGMIVLLLLGLAIASMFGFNLATEMGQMMRDTYAILDEVMLQPISPELIDAQIQLMTQLIPTYIIMIALYYSLITHWLGRKLLRRVGYDVAALPPVRKWTLPKSVVWVYIGVLVLSLFTSESDPSIFTMIFYNLLPILTIAFCVQGVSFLFFVAHLRRWGYLLPIGGIIACFFFSTLMSLIGVFDIILDMRQRMLGNRS